MTREKITPVVSALSDLLSVVRRADPADKAEIYTRLNLRLTYQPDERIVRTEMQVVSPAQYWQFDSVRGAIDPITPCLVVSRELQLRPAT